MLSDQSAHPAKEPGTSAWCYNQPTLNAMTFASTEFRGPLKDGTGLCINLPSDEVKQNELAENATVERDIESFHWKGLIAYDCMDLNIVKCITL